MAKILGIDLGTTNSAMAVMEDVYKRQLFNRILKNPDFSLQKHGTMVSCGQKVFGDVPACGAGSFRREGVAMSHPVIEADECIGCGICVDACPQEVLEVVGGTADVVNEEACIACGDCVEECPMGAIAEVVED